MLLVEACGFRALSLKGGRYELARPLKGRQPHGFNRPIIQASPRMSFMTMQKEVMAFAQDHNLDKNEQFMYKISQLPHEERLPALQAVVAESRQVSDVLEEAQQVWRNDFIALWREGMPDWKMAMAAEFAEYGRVKGRAPSGDRAKKASGKD